MTRTQFESQDCASYNAGPPWIFSGRAFYQLHLVKAEVAKRFIPSDLQIVQAFGYTLGGLYLAQYDSSPAGAFDELVVIAGTIWNPPTSCAWAARVLVNSREACDHGKKEVGLPSRVAKFSHVLEPIEPSTGFWRQLNPFSRLFPRTNKDALRQSAVDIIETDNSSTRPLCKIKFPLKWYGLKENQWTGPAISMSLPSFSGKTFEQPELLKYSCHLKCSVRPVKSAIISVPTSMDAAKSVRQDHNFKSILAILAAKPILSLCFEKMMMHVEAPMVVRGTQTASHTTSPRVLGESALAKAS